MKKQQTTPAKITTKSIAQDYCTITFFGYGYENQLSISFWWRFEFDDVSKKPHIKYQKLVGDYATGNIFGFPQYTGKNNDGSVETIPDYLFKLQRFMNTFKF